MKHVIDLRSDTAAQPTRGVREAALTAELGDDLLREDCSTNNLLSSVCGLFGMEDAMLSPSGTMSNQIAVAAFTEPGDEVLLGPESHIMNLEAGGIAINSNAQVRCIEVHRGIYNTDSIEEAIRRPTLQSAKTSLICLESSYDLNAGYTTPIENIQAIRKIAEQHHLPVYLDGARVLNTVSALDVEPHDLSRHVDAMHLSLNKGLGAPIGSVLVGTKPFIARARRIRQRLGGGIRHTGFIAAPALVALQDWRTRLQQDHLHAERLADEIDRITGLRVLNKPVPTNIVCVELGMTRIEADELVKYLSNRHVLVKKLSENSIRLVMHQSISLPDIERTITAFKNAIVAI